MSSFENRGTAPRTLVKIILMLGLALVGVAALATEPSKPGEGCAMTRFDYDGRVVENGTVTDNWTLTCWRHSPEQAAVPAAKPVTVQPVATRPAGPPPARELF